MNLTGTSTYGAQGMVAFLSHCPNLENLRLWHYYFGVCPEKKK